MISNQISAINGLHMVHLYHLSSADSPVYGILAYYRDQTINLTNTDTHFTALLDRLANVYAQEAASSDIYTDEATKAFLRKAAGCPDEFYEKMLTGYTAVKTPMIAPKAFTHVYILPIVRYILDLLYDTADEDFSFAPLNKQWFGKGMLDAHKGKTALHFPYRLLCHSPLYTEVNLSNVLSEGNTFNIYISLTRNGLTVSCNDRLHAYEGIMSYTVSGDDAELSVFFTKKGEVLINTKDTFPAGDAEAPTERVLKLSGTTAKDWSSVTTPWGSRVYTASKDGCEYRVFRSEDKGMTISHLSCFRYLTDTHESSLAFGLYAFCLYEHEDITELHFLDQASPASGLYAARYAGNCYTI